MLLGPRSGSPLNLSKEPFPCQLIRPRNLSAVFFAAIAVSLFAFPASFCARTTKLKDGPSLTSRSFSSSRGCLFFAAARANASRFMPSIRSSIVLLRKLLRTVTPRLWLFSSLLGWLVSIRSRISVAAKLAFSRWRASALALSRRLPS